MSIQVLAGNSRRLLGLAAVLVALVPNLVGVARAAEEIIAALPDAAVRGDPAFPPFEFLISRVIVNSTMKGDIAVVRDGKGHLLVPAADFAAWKLAYPSSASVVLKGETYVDVSSLSGITAKFDPDTVTLDLQVEARAFPGTTLDLAPRRQPNVIYPAENSIFLNYAFNASGDEAFGERRYQFTTELAARSGNWLFYNTANQPWGNGGPADGFTRLMTNAQYDDRPNLRRLTLGDFFTPSFDLSGSVPLGGVSLTKYYSMDPYFIQYPTASFRTDVALPSTVVVRVGGNVVAQREVQPGPLDVSNINGVTGAQNVSVVVRDAFGREQQLQQPFFFATNAGLAEGLHEYSYNVGFVRRQYGIVSDDYGDLAAAAFHRYAFTNELTLGLRGQATRDLYNVGPFGTYQFPRLGLIAAGVSVGGGNGQSGAAGSVAYAYTGNNLSLNLGARYFSRDYAQLADLVSGFRTRSDQYGSVSAFDPTLGTLTAAYTATDRYEGPATRVWNVGYTHSALAGKGLLSLNYTRTVEPSSTSAWLLSFRYYFDSETSVAAGVGGARNSTSQSVSLDRAVPQGEGIGYSFTAAHVGGNGPDTSYGQAFAQLNAEHIAVSANYSRTAAGDGGPSFSQVTVAGSIGASGGSVFAARPVLDSFALVRIPDQVGVPVYANGWYAGKTDSRGEVVATNLVSYYDNYIRFGTADLSFDYVFDSSERVISPPLRSGTLVAFDVKRNHAIVGVLVETRAEGRVPLEFQDFHLERDGRVLSGFTARRGEFYLEGVEPGPYQLRVDRTPGCAARVMVPALVGAVTDIGKVACESVAR